MPDQAEHVVLLPPGCDDAWWSVVKEYVVHFQVKVSQPESDCDGVNPVQKAITVLDVPGGWEGDFVACLEDRFPGVELDVIQVSDPQSLGALLAERVATQDRFGESQVLALAWPTDAQATIQQRFGASPWLYRQWGGLPGHEGIDFATRQDAPVFACADGYVYLVDSEHSDQVDSHPYGVHVRIRHRLGKEVYHTIYAHLASVCVVHGQRVSKGQQLGMAQANDDERGPTGTHLHLSLRREGAGARGYATDLVDPELYIVWPDGWRLEPVSALPHIFGVHEDVEHEMAQSMGAAGVQGYILWSEELGLSTCDGCVGRDYSAGAGAFGHTAIARLNYGYQPNGTLPASDGYAEFAQSCAEWVKASEGCRIWVVGNEPNTRREHPRHERITPELYAKCFNMVYSAIKVVQPDSIVALAPVHPTDTSMGDPRSYFCRVLEQLEAVDAFALHAFTHGPDPSFITSSHKFQLPPLDWQYYHFRMFEPYLEAIPEQWSRLPVYLTAVHHVFKSIPRDLGWLDHNKGWVWEMYRNVDEWNRRGGQQIHCALLYRYPELDEWAFRGRTEVLTDFIQAMGMGCKPFEHKNVQDALNSAAAASAHGVHSERLGVAIHPVSTTAAASESDDNEDVKQNLLVNPTFETEWSASGGHRCMVIPEGSAPEIRDIGSIFTPSGWLPWFRHKPGKWDQPEVRDAWVALDPRRVHNGQKAAMLFTFFRSHDAGFLQQVQVAPGTRVRLSAWAHAWSNHSLAGHESCGDDPYCSCGVGRGTLAALQGTLPSDADPWVSALGNFTFRVGIDPTGGTNPLANTVVWGQGLHAYNAYAQVPFVETAASGNTVTVFLRSTTQWAFKHNDAYWDDVELTATSSSPASPDVEMGHSPSLLRVGDTVTIVASALGSLTDVKFLVQTPSGAQTYLSDIQVGSDNNRITWTVSYLLQEEGTYQVAVTADLNSGVVHTFGCEAVPVGTRGTPRIQYERTYVLLPPQAGEEWALAVVDGAWDQHRFTIGGSADDAGIGDLNGRSIFAVNPGLWSGDLSGFFETHYPGVQYEAISASTPDELMRILASRD